MDKPTAKYRLVMHELGRCIVSGEVRPGDVLPREDVLAKGLQVSRGALREALKVLSAKGMIGSCSGIGARVHEAERWVQLDADVLAWRCAFSPTGEFVDQLLEMQRIFEPAAAASAAQRRSEKQLAVIRQACRAMAAARTPDLWMKAELQFHETVLHATGNEFLRSLLPVFENAMKAPLLLDACVVGDFNISLPRYQKAAEAIRDRQPERASEAMQEIIDDVRDRLRRDRYDRSSASNEQVF